MINSGEEQIKNLKNLSKKELVIRAKKFAKKYYVGDGKKFRLKDYSTQPKMTLGPEDKPLVKEALEQGIQALATLQDILYTQDNYSLLVIFQAMDAAGKDGGIKHVMSGINPQGCQVSSFKAPSAEELDHDFLWRCFKRLPERGRIGIFNRSYYEEVLIVKVHEAILKNQKLPPKLINKNIWKQRYEDIRNFEKYLCRNGTVVIKIFLHVSKDEQKQRFIDRIDDPSKNWKFSTGDVKERAYWGQYQEAYEEMIKNTSTKDSPWYVIPADNKSYARIGIAAAIISALERMDLEYPQISAEKIAELQEVKKVLLEMK
ncbi:polyphosphate:nucleotide phosphotransferase, PPK2 family [Algoriphagus alkaliphilus]|uniref:Polyphosphate:nucleotide phosphotransferase, PPK2 family n=1 Tax=Algoriphagus alkaliphilus TaxID=279824 RepID=A0A1G5ZBB5_9BACT|nr:polyphosphate kinase 2 family protein [Algoriphagus alkaliphilus]SDA92249.1 polyphosphate:nucleotide phosphotransferase, PPK2 family [Algoriphagus alkaliphilus]